MKQTVLLLTCEHGGNRIPNEYKYIFPAESETVLESHRGWDPGTLALGKFLAGQFHAPLFASDISRLLVDLNRSTWRRTLFSEYVKGRPQRIKKDILERVYYPYQTKVENFVQEAISGGEKVCHLALHSFTPVLNGKQRNADLGLLYNPARENEKQFARLAKKQSKNILPGWNVRFNYPYLGKPDGLCARLRKKHSDNDYLGIEIEINQKYVEPDGRFPDGLSDKVTLMLDRTRNNFRWICQTRNLY